MPRALDYNALKNVAESASNARGAFASLDYSGFNKVGAILDFSEDLPIALTLDPTADTPENAKDRASKRRNVLGGLIRNARKAHKLDTLDLRAFYADAPMIDKDGKAVLTENVDKDGAPVPATVRVYAVKRVK